jgi:hypothetical protein
MLRPAGNTTQCGQFIWETMDARFCAFPVMGRLISGSPAVLPTPEGIFLVDPFGNYKGHEMCLVEL